MSRRPTFPPHAPAAGAPPEHALNRRAVGSAFLTDAAEALAGQPGRDRPPTGQPGVQSGHDNRKSGIIGCV
jgi:hypothetical protein